MLIPKNFSYLLNERFFRNFLPIPATNKISLGQLTPDFLLPDITHQSTIQLSSYRGQKPVVLAFTRIFTDQHYCPLCYPHIVELNQHYEQLLAQGVELLLISSTDTRQSRQVVHDLGLKMPFLSNPSCDIFRLYQVGQALGAPLPAQFILDSEGNLRYKHLFSFFSPNLDTESLVNILESSQLRL